MIIRGIRKSPIQKETIFDIVRGFKQVSEIDTALRDLHKKYESLLEETSSLSSKEIQNLLQEIRSEADKKLAGLVQAAADSNASTFNRMFSDLRTHVDTAIAAVEHAKTIQKGDPGTPGADAPTPVRGKDYFTAEDVQLLVQMVLNQIRQPEDGKDAIISDEMIKSALELYFKENKISHKNIGDLEEIIAPVRHAAVMRGGGDTVAAGSNITITRDMATGKATIASTGGAGSGYQSATGTVNGVNATFVFSTAPSVIVVDGKPIQKTSSDGTTNWTGTTTVVLTIAPTFDIYATA